MVNRFTRFTDPTAVATWDRLFRWRHEGALRDLTVDATWERVATWAVGADRRQSAWKHRYIDEFSAWRMLPGPSLLRYAGTAEPLAAAVEPTAVLNAAAFVQSSRGASCIDHAGMMETAALAVRLLDDALIASGAPCDRHPALKIGLIGLADALERLGIAYTGDDAGRHAAAIASDLAVGCLQGSVALARERGVPACAGQRTASPAWYRCLHLFQDLHQEFRRWGRRHAGLTVIDSQPGLALLANNVADALDPRPGRDLHASAGAAHVDGIVLAQLRIRGCVQPWIDAPVCYPLLSPHPVSDPPTLLRWQRIAEFHNLPAPRFRTWMRNCDD